MAKLPLGILGPVAGKVGNVVGGSWKGVDYLRSMPASVTNPRTKPQLNQRSRFVLMLRFLQPMLDFIKIGYKAYAKKMSTYNAAMSYNLRNAVTGEFPDVSILYDQVLVSRGNLRSLSAPAVTSPSSGLLEATWVDNTGMGNARSTDKVMVLVYNIDASDVYFNLDAAQRADGSFSLALPDAWLGQQVHVWL